MIQSSYLSNILDQQKLPELVESTSHAILASEVRFDSIVIRGCSGLIIGPMVACWLNKPFTIVRKENEDCHSWNNVEGFVTPYATYIIIDDTISTGSTVRHIRDAIRRSYNGTCEAVFLYDDYADKTQCRVDGMNWAIIVMCLFTGAYRRECLGPMDTNQWEWDGEYRGRDSRNFLVRLRIRIRRWLGLRLDPWEI